MTRLSSRQYQNIGQLVLSSEASTTLVDADTYYNVNGTYSDDMNKLFDTDSSGFITYLGSEGRFLVVADADFKVDKVCTLNCAISVNGVTEEKIGCIKTMEHANSYTSVASCNIIDLDKGDIIRPIVKSTVANTVVTYYDLMINLIQTLI